MAGIHGCSGQLDWFETCSGGCMPLVGLCLFVAGILSTGGGVLRPASSSGDGRTALVHALERLIATGEPHDVGHDDGELLQESVDDAIRRGDAQIERLATRAATPLVVRVARPVASVQAPPSLDINASSVLKLARPAEYTARIEGSVDGGRFVQLATVKSGANSNARIDTGPARRRALAPGFHHISLRARLRFTPPDGQATEWTETRDLPSVAYAVYDENVKDPADARAFLFGHLVATAQHFDAQLPAVPLGRWVEQTLRPRVGPDRPSIVWVMQFCDERTSEAGTAPRTGSLCSVGYFGPRGVIGQLWFRTGRISETQNGFAWERELPIFEGISMHEGGADLGALSALSDLLDAVSESRPRGDVSIAPNDIVITAGAGTSGSATITLRNQGDVALHRVFVDVAVAAQPTDDGGRSRHFVIDIPARGSTDVTLPVIFPAGYGVVAVTAMQATEHGTYSDWMSFDPTPEDAVAFRIFNVQAAPAGYLNIIREACGCRGW